MKLAFITYNYFYFFSRFVHPLAKMFYGEVHKDDGIMLKIFQFNPIYHLRYIDKAKFPTQLSCSSTILSRIAIGL